MKSRILFALVLLFSATASTFAVTDGEMEQARVITAKNYLRWTNNGSGYLDEIKDMPKTMAEFKKVLKTKELENLKTFEKVSVPKDYASWDKDKLVSYWSETFMSSPVLDEQGRRAHGRVASAIRNMKVAPPSKEAPAPQQEQTESTPLANAEAAQNAGAPETPAADSIADEIAGALAASDTIAADTEAQIEDSAERPKKSNATWIYVGILILLVAVVVALVIYAARSMKGDKSGSDPDDSDEIGTAPLSIPERSGNKAYNPGETVDRKEHEFMIERKNEKIRKVKAELDVVREENARLQAAHDALQTRLSQAQTQIESLRLALSESEKRGGSEVSARPEESRRPVRALYLGRVNRNGLFVRADRQLNPEASVYRLESEDGYTGTFRVVNTTAVTERALDNPEHWLAGGCTGNNLDDTDGVSQIITETSGTAVLEDGCWKMARKAKIKYS